MHRYRMDLGPSEQLMTLEEAQRLSTLENYGVGAREERRRKPAIWAWQTVEGAMAQTVTDEQVDRVLNERRR